MSQISRRILPGFGLSLGYTLFVLSILVLIPLSACFAKAMSISPQQFWAAVWNERAIAAYRFSLTSSLAAAAASITLGLVIAWVLVRYEFPLKRVFDSLVDLPFALPTAVAGLVYAKLYVKNGWFGQVLAPLGINVAYTQVAVVLVLTFLGVPFVVRTLQPVLESLDADTEEAAYLLGASRWQAFQRVILPTVLPAIITGFALALARGLGEYGSVIFVARGRPFESEIAPVLIVSRLEEFAYAEATAIAVVLLVISFVLLILVNLLERWSKRHYA